MEKMLLLVRGVWTFCTYERDVHGHDDVQLQ